MVLSRAVALAGVVVAATLVALPDARTGPDFVVRQRDRTFLPMKLTVPRDTIVRFVNDEGIVHHAYVESATFNADSGDIAPGAAGQLRFDKDGRFLVRCAIHPRMRLEVDVTP